jgi:hypothetical protein
MGNSISGCSNGIVVGGTATIGGTTAGAGNSISGNSTGVLVQNGGAATITGNSITGNSMGITAGLSVVTALYNDLSGNSDVGVFAQPGATPVTAIYDWWGSSTGPTNANNPGGTGSVASGNVVFSPWLTDIQPVFSALSDPTVTYGTPSVTLSGTILVGSIAPPGSVSITVGVVTQSAAIQANGNFSSVFDSASLGVASSPYTISYAYAATAGYPAATDTGQVLTVTPVTPTITWSTPANIVYGTALSRTQLDAATSVPGTFTYTPDAGTVLGAGSNQALRVTSRPLTRLTIGRHHSLLTSTSTEHSRHSAV